MGLSEKVSFVSAPCLKSSAGTGAAHALRLHHAHSEGLQVEA